MQETYVENIAEIIKNKSKLQKQLNVKLTNKGKNIFVNGKAEDEFLALEVLEAINLGFSANKALHLKQEDAILQTLNIKDITKRHDLDRVRARIIGKYGKTLKTLNSLTNCDLSLHNNSIGIIGDAEEIKDAVQAITSLVQGSKQANVYSRLEKHKKEKRMQRRNMGVEFKGEL